MDSISSLCDFWFSTSKTLIDSISSSNKDILNPVSLSRGNISIISPRIDTSPLDVTISTK